MIRVVCTDRGTHPDRMLGWLFRVSGGVEFRPYAPRRQLRGGADRPAQTGILRPPRCPTCRRRPWRSLTQERAAAVYDALTAAGVSRLDISHTVLS